MYLFCHYSSSYQSVHLKTDSPYKKTFSLDVFHYTFSSGQQWLSTCSFTLWVTSNRTQENSLKLLQGRLEVRLDIIKGRFRFDIKEDFVMEEVVKRWNGLPREMGGVLIPGGI